MPLYGPATAVSSTFTPADHGLVGWTDDVFGDQAGTLWGAAGTLHLARLKVTGSVVTNILFHFTAGGTTLTAGQCFAALYNDAGALLGAGAVTADQSTNWVGGGAKTCALTTPQAVTPGATYKVAWWWNGTTQPTMTRGLNSAAAITNVNLTAPNFRFGTADTGLTTTAPANIGTQTGGITAWWVGVS